MSSHGVARYTPNVVQFLNSCPAVISFTEVDNNWLNFEFDPTIEVLSVPRGVFFNSEMLWEDEVVI